MEKLTVLGCNSNLICRLWQSNTIENIVIIVHGMAEHCERYDHIGKELNTKNCLVVSYNQQGHGPEHDNTIQNNQKHNLGHLPPHSWNSLLTDLDHVIQQVKKAFPNAPVTLLGHSMGSFIVQGYMQQKQNKSIKHVILTGSAYEPPLLTWFSSNVMLVLGQLFSYKKPATYVQKLLFGSYNLNIKNRKTVFDWLSKNHENVTRYINDPYCGFSCSYGFFHTLFSGLNTIYKKNNIARFPNDIPITLISGLEDPLSKNGKTVKTLVKQYKESGCKHISLHLVEKCRHEVLNEKNIIVLKLLKQIIN